MPARENGWNLCPTLSLASKQLDLDHLDGRDALGLAKLSSLPSSEPTKTPSLPQRTARALAQRTTECATGGGDGIDDAAAAVAAGAVGAVGAACAVDAVNAAGAGEADVRSGGAGEAPPCCCHGCRALPCVVAPRAVQQQV